MTDNSDRKYVTRGEFEQFTTAIGDRFTEFSDRTDKHLGEIGKQVEKLGQAVNGRFQTLENNTYEQFKTKWGPIWSAVSAIVAAIGIFGGVIWSNLDKDISRLDKNIDNISANQLQAAKNEGRLEATIESLQKEVHFLVSERALDNIKAIHKGSTEERKVLIDELLKRHYPKGPISGSR